MSWRWLHKWLSIMIGAQILIWVLSGFIISLLDEELVDGRSTSQPIVNTATIATARPLFDVTELALPKDVPVYSLTLTRALNQLVYRVSSDAGLLVFDAHTGSAFSLDQTQAEQLAMRSYIGSGDLVMSSVLPTGSTQVAKRYRHLKQWEVSFEDSINTRVYIDALSGEVLAHRNSYSRFVDFLLMLHFMDYAEEGSFNNWPIRVIGFASLWLAMSGMILLKTSFLPASRRRKPRKS